MKSSASKIKMTSFDALFGEETPTEATENTIQELPLNQLVTFKNHPYKVVDDDLMEDTKDSIAKNGVLMPIIVRPCDDNTYEIIAGHRRKRACELLEIGTIPAIVRDIDDDTATIIMVDTNIQRENQLFSEKAFAFKMKLEAIKRKAGRPKNNGTQVAHHLEGKKSVEIIAEDANVSKDQVRRYIRLTELVTPLLSMTDDKKIAFNTAVELSYLIKEEQEILLAKMSNLKVIPSMAQATKLKKYSTESGLTDVLIDSILSETAAKPVQVTFKKEKLNKYFPETYTAEQMEEVITSLLEKWQAEQN